MSCCGGNPNALGPHPPGWDGRLPPRVYNRRAPTNPGSARLENGVLVRRRATFFSGTLHRISLLLQRPSALKFWEVVLLFFMGFAAYAAFGSVRRQYNLVARVDINEICPGGSFANCARFMMLMGLYEVWLWLGKVVPWGFVAAVVAFVGEEATAAIKRKS